MSKPITALTAMVCLLPGLLLAQQNNYPVWRCGHEFTNQPRPGENCQQVDLPANSPELVRCRADEAALRRELARSP